MRETSHALMHQDLEGPSTTPRGRATKYTGVADDRRAYELALLGYIDAEIAIELGISPSTLYNWKRKYPAFADAIARGGTKTNFRVIQALLTRALGGIVVETKEVVLRNADGSDRIVVLELQRYIPPDVRAIIFWLTNRDPEHWKIYKPADYPPPAPQPPIQASWTPEARAEIDQYLKTLK